MSNPVVGLLIDKFLTSLADSTSTKTYEWYAGFLREFRPFAGERRASSVSPSLVHQWIAQRYANSSLSTQHGAGRCVCRLFSWAVEEGKLATSPLRNFRKKRCESRERILSGKEYAILLKAADPRMRDVIKFMWHTGCRPQELRAIEAKYLGDRKVVLPLTKSKGEKKRRVIYLDGMANGIACRLAEVHPLGPLFRSRLGRPWNKGSLCNAFIALRHATGIQGVCAYTIRHTWITRRLEAGAGVASVAALAGNSPQMIMRVYSHVAENEEHLRQQLGK